MKYIRLSICFILFVVGLASVWVYYNFGTVTIPQVMANLSKMGAISSEIYLNFLGFVILPACFLIFLNKKISFGIAFVSLIAGNYVFNISSYILNKNVYSSIYEDEFILVKAEEVTPPTKKKNLVVIYVESLEEQYANLLYSDEVLTPYLQTQKNEALHFEGYYQLPETKYTLAGMMGSECGIKDNFGFVQAYSIANLYPQIACIPDILAQKGYHNFFYKSADLDFANTIFYAQQHNFETMKGYSAWKNENPDNPNIKGNSWGARDSFLYQQIKKTILDMQKQNKPYSIFAITVDTHGELDFIDPICHLKEKSPKNTVKCADMLLKDFIEWCKKQTFYKDMTIVVIGDHTAHGVTNPIYKKQPQNRQIENLIFNPVRKDAKEHLWTTFDLAPTIMEAIGYEMPALGLGRSLFEIKPTVYEKYGKKFDVLLQQNSKFLQKLSDFVLPDIDVFFKIKKDKIYQSEEDFKQLIPYSNQTFLALGRLWFKHLNLEVCDEKDYKLSIDAIAASENKDRKFEIFANDIKIGDMIFEVDHIGTQNFEIIIPKEVIKNKKIKLKFENNDIKHWNITSLGIGVNKLSLN